MSSDYYFNKWRDTLRRLQNAVDTDIILQDTKVHEKMRCRAAQRLAGVLGEYIAVYNDIMDSAHQNLQVQKIKYMADVAHAVEDRILELKHQLSKLEAIDYQFLSQGLIEHNLTTYDAEFQDIPLRVERPDYINKIIEDVMKKAQEERERLAQLSNKVEEVPKTEEQWWDDEFNQQSNSTDNKIEKNETDEETLKKKAFLALIGAHEKSRQTIRQITQQNVKRDTWEKELKGILQPKARLEVRVTAAKMIQKFCRAYFELKRKRIKDCKRDEMLGFRMCIKPKNELKGRIEEMSLHRKKMRMKYVTEWKSICEELKQRYLKRKSEEIAEDYRDGIRTWFQTWFDEVKFFYEIPNGGSVLIFNEEVPTPVEWLKQYKEYIAQKIANKGKSALQLKYEKMEAKQEEMRLKKELLMKKKLEAALMKKAKKNPNMHPGYTYPASKKTEEILKAIGKYHKDWHDMDEEETCHVKEKYVKHIDENNAWMEIKLEVMNAVDDDMRNELKVLKKALKEDYLNNEEEMPETIKEKKKRERKKPKVKPTTSENIVEKMENLAVKGYLKEYPKTRLEDFIGDPNFAADEIRCNFKSAVPFNGEIRSIWWERCREMVHGFHRILIVGSSGSGKTKLVHALATLNDAALFELDPLQFQDEIQSSAAYLQSLINSITTCAKVAQPSVIYIRNIHQLFYKKVPPEEVPINRDVLKTYFVKKLIKKINKSDNITIIGSCIDPWLTKNPILKTFPTVMLMPNTSYSTTFQILGEWVLNNYRTIPSNFDIHSLAYLLQGYDFGYLKDCLKKFMSSEMIIKTAANGLKPEQVYDYIVQNENVSKTDYEKYQKWYFDMTYWGNVEKKDIAEQKEFKEIIDKWEEKAKKKKRAPQSSGSSLKSDRS